MDQLLLFCFLNLTLVREKGERKWGPGYYKQVYSQHLLTMKVNKQTNTLKISDKIWKSTVWNNLEDGTNTALNTSVVQGHHHMKAEQGDEKSLWLPRTIKKHASYVQYNLMNESENII